MVDRSAYLTIAWLHISLCNCLDSWREDLPDFSRSGRTLPSRLCGTSSSAQKVRRQRKALG